MKNKKHMKRSLTRNGEICHTAHVAAATWCCVSLTLGVLANGPPLYRPCNTKLDARYNRQELFDAMPARDLPTSNVCNGRTGAEEFCGHRLTTPRGCIRTNLIGRTLDRPRHHPHTCKSTKRISTRPTSSSHAIYRLQSP